MIGKDTDKAEVGYGVAGQQETKAVRERYFEGELYT
jgi:hypothetical protein